MHTFKCIWIILGLAVSTSVLLAQQDGNCGLANTTFQPGEKITYAMSYTWFFIWTDVGEVTFQATAATKLGHEAIHLSAKGVSYPFFDIFFKVRDVFESWVDPKNLKPIYFYRDIYEGGYTKENECHFDWRQNKVKARIKRRGRESRFYSIEVQPCTFDVISAIYNSRNFSYTNLFHGKSFPVSVLLDRTIYNVKYTFLERTVITVRNLGDFCTLKFRVELVAGDVFKDGQYLYVWLTDDANRLPVYIESPIRVGSVRARILGWEGLRHELTSRVKPAEK